LSPPYSGFVRIVLSTAVRYSLAGRRMTNAFENLVQGWVKCVLCLRSFCLLCLFPLGGVAQVATIDDAWWTYQQDCNGDNCHAGTLAGDFARLNWNPDVTNCNGTLTVFEIVYSKNCASSLWTALYTNPVHSITGCRSSDSQSL